MGEAIAAPGPTDGHRGAPPATGVDTFSAPSSHLLPPHVSRSPVCRSAPEPQGTATLLPRSARARSRPPTGEQRRGCSLDGGSGSCSWPESQRREEAGC